MNDTLLQLQRWQALDAQAQSQVRALTLSAAQIEYAGTMDRAIAACEAADPDAVAGLAIVHQGRPVGFVVLSRKAALPAWAAPASVALTAMRIDAAVQGQGIGQAALWAVDGWLRTHWPDAQSLALSVDDDNLAGRRAYARAGYAEYAEPKPGRIGLVRYLSKSLAAEGAAPGDPVPLAPPDPPGAHDPFGPLDADVHQMAQRSGLCWLATADAQGRPNVSPKEIFALVDAQHLVIAHIASPVSVRNIATNPQVCVSLVDVFAQKGFKLTGTARVLARGDAEFARWAAPLCAMAGPRFTVQAVLLVRATDVAPILAPSYRLYPEQTTEASQVASAMQRYGVRPVERDEAGGAPPAP